MVVLARILQRAKDLGIQARSFWTGTRIDTTKHIACIAPTATGEPKVRTTAHRESKGTERNKLGHTISGEVTLRNLRGHLQSDLELKSIRSSLCSHTIWTENGKRLQVVKGLDPSTHCLVRSFSSLRSDRSSHHWKKQKQSVQKKLQASTVCWKIKFVSGSNWGFRVFRPDWDTTTFSSGDLRDFPPPAASSRKAGSRDKVSWIKGWLRLTSHDPADSDSESY